MAKHSRENNVTNLKISQEHAEKLLNERIKLGIEILKLPITGHENLDIAKSEYYAWDKYNSELLKRIFDTDELVIEYVGLAFASIGTTSLQVLAKDHIDEVKRSLDRLASIIERLPLFASSLAIEERAQEKETKITNEIFIVHGHDEGIKQSVARFLEKFELKPIILSEQPNGGKTIIEKFERDADVGFAVVLMTPDDKGGLNQDGADERPRARQNVIFELGYFIGRLGRDRVCALYKHGVETPSDFSGVAYVPYSDNNNSWKLELALELKNAGYDIDMNKMV